MFSRFLWRYHYKRFIKRWHDTQATYTHFQYFQEIVSLIDGIPSMEIPELYRENTHIASAYATIVVWLVEARGIIDSVNRDDLEPQLAVTIVNRPLVNYLVTENGLLVSYASAIQATLEQLQLLYKAILQHNTVVQDYYFRQLKELFLSGLALCLSVVEEYASN